MVGHQLEILDRQLQRVLSHPYRAPAGAAVDRPGLLEREARNVPARPRANDPAHAALTAGPAAAGHAALLR